MQPWKGSVLLTSLTRFLLARLHVDSLLDKRTKSKVLLILKNLGTGPDAVHAAYDKAMERIEGQLPEDRALANRVLSWIIYAKRRLTTQELSHALAVEPGTTELDMDNIPDIIDIVSVCAGLVTVDEESDIIRPVHYTTQEYFEEIWGKWNHSCQRDISSTCLTYLCFDVFWCGHCQFTEDADSRIKQSPFLRYAFEKWGEHALHVEEHVSEQAVSFLKDRRLVSGAIKTLRHENHFPTFFYPRINSGVTGLHLAAGSGLSKIVTQLLNIPDGYTANVLDDLNRSPLHHAAREGCGSVIELLLEREDVNVNSKDRSDEAPLSLAIQSRHDTVIKLLLTRDDINVNSKHGEDDETPLYYAIHLEYDTVIKLLLK